MIRLEFFNYIKKCRLPILISLSTMKYLEVPLTLVESSANDSNELAI